MAITTYLLGNMETIGPLLRKTRERKGIRAADLAFQIGKDPSYLSKLERDLLKEIPEPEVLAALERILEISQERMLRALGYQLSRSAQAATAITPEREAVLYVLDQMEPDVARAFAEAGEILLRLRRTETLAHRQEERMPAIR